MSKKYFGTDGIRGTANSFPMTADIDRGEVGRTARIGNTATGNNTTGPVIRIEPLPVAVLRPSTILASPSGEAPCGGVR